MLLCCLFDDNYYQLRNVYFDNNIVYENMLTFYNISITNLYLKSVWTCFIKKKTISGFNILRYHQYSLIGHEIVNFNYYITYS